MTRTVRLLGSPSIDESEGDAYRFRSRKSWALLAYLLLGTRAPSRSELAGLLFAETDDPLRALRWCLAEIRRGLGADGAVVGDPVVVTLASEVRVDARVVSGGSWSEALAQPGLGRDLLEGLEIRGAPTFATWLLAERRRAAAASESILHEAALATAARGEVDRAREAALRAVAMNPLDENHQALLIRLYHRAGDEAAARQQFEAYARLLEEEVGAAPGPAVREALDPDPDPGDQAADDASIRAVAEAGSAAISAGALEHGLTTLRTAVRLADGADAAHLQVHARLVLAEALIHSLRGLDQEGLTSLHEADRIARALGDGDAVSRARAELGYVDFLRGRYNRAEVWLRDAAAWAAGSPTLQARARTYLGSVESDRADYPRALALLEEAVQASRVAAEPRREAYALSIIGRIHLLRGDPDAAAELLRRAIALAESDHWLSFLPWPQSLLGEAQLAQHRVAEASRTLEQSFARACQLGDPCWEGLAARGLALTAEAAGDTRRAFDLLGDARTRCTRLADPYVWLEVYILDALCLLGRRHGHAATGRWVEQMRELAARCGMRELTARALLHAAALDDEGAASAARLVAADVDNPVLARLLDAPAPRRSSVPMDPTGAGRVL